MDSKRKNASVKKAFTLIELLVVISVIGLLAGVVLVSMNGLRAKARDSKRVSTIEQIQKALELYYNENGFYPQTPSDGWVHDCSGDNSWGNFLASSLAEFMPSIPNDPKYPDNSWPLCFYYKSGNYGNCPLSNNTYVMLFATEISTFDLNEYDVLGEGGSKERYCFHGSE